MTATVFIVCWVVFQGSSCIAGDPIEDYRKKGCPQPECAVFTDAQDAQNALSRDHAAGLNAFYKVKVPIPTQQPTPSIELMCGFWDKDAPYNFVARDCPPEVIAANRDQIDGK